MYSGTTNNDSSPGLWSEPNPNTTTGVACAGCGRDHDDQNLLDANRIVRKHTYKAGVIVYCELPTTAQTSSGQYVRRTELYIVVLKQRESGYYQPFAKGSYVDENRHQSTTTSNSLSTAVRELLEETGIKTCVKTLRGDGPYDPPMSHKTTFFITSQPDLTELAPASGPFGLPNREIESAEWMQFSKFMDMIRENPKAMSTTSWKLFPLVLDVLRRSVSPLFSGTLLDACQQYPQPDPKRRALDLSSPVTTMRASPAPNTGATTVTHTAQKPSVTARTTFAWRRTQKMSSILYH
jgi:8-oxo-dGTP pyrophosphatase MutT (NUDIX family)